LGSDAVLSVKLSTGTARRLFFLIFDDRRAAHAHGTKQPCGLMFKGIFQKGVYGWLPLNGFSKAFKRSLNDLSNAWV